MAHRSPRGSCTSRLSDSSYPLCDPSKFVRIRPDTALGIRILPRAAPCFEIEVNSQRDCRLTRAACENRGPAPTEQRRRGRAAGSAGRRNARSTAPRSREEAHVRSLLALPGRSTDSGAAPRRPRRLDQPVPGNVHSLRYVVGSDRRTRWRTDAAATWRITQTPRSDPLVRPRNLDSPWLVRVTSMFAQSGLLPSHDVL